MFSRVALAAALVGAACGLMACEGVPQQPNSLVVFLLADASGGRWADVDEPSFSGRLRRACLGCDYLLQDADGQRGTQLEQAEAALDQGADVLVVHAVDREVGEEIIVAAGEVPVVAYERFVPGADYYVSHDPAAVGRLQGEYAVARLERRDAVTLVSGPVVEDAQVERLSALRETIGAAGVGIAVDAELPNRSARAARSFAGRRLRSRSAGLGEVLVTETDAQAAAVLGVLLASGGPTRELPAVIGAGADLAAARRIVTGEQAMTVAFPAAEQAIAAADLAITLVTGGEPRVLTRYEGVPAYLFSSAVVDVASLTDTLVRNGPFTPEQICTPAILGECERLGIR